MKDTTKRLLFTISFYGAPLLGVILGVVLSFGDGLLSVMFGILAGIVAGYVFSFLLFLIGLYFLPTLFAEENFRIDWERGSCGRTKNKTE